MVAPVQTRGPHSQCGWKGTADSPLRTTGSPGFWLCCRLFPHGGGLYKEPLLKLSRWVGRRASRQNAVNDLLVLVLWRWPSSPELRLLSGGCFLPSAFEVLLLASGGPAQLSPREGLILFPVPAVLLSPCEFPGVETAWVRRSAAFIVWKPSNSERPSGSVGPLDGDWCGVWKASSWALGELSVGSAIGPSRALSTP